MTLAFKTKLFQKIAPAIHPADLTTRPQILEKNNPKYDLINDFGKLTVYTAYLIRHKYSWLSTSM